MILSILIPVTPDRCDMVQPLYSELQRQINNIRMNHYTLGEAEVIVDDRARFLDGGPSIGKKREDLVNKAKGIYSTFIDSDDIVPGNYVEAILRAARSNMDIITFKAISRLREYWTLIDMGLYFPNDQANPNFTARRQPSIVCPVKSEFAKLHKFEDINYGEDYGWMSKVVAQCTNEYHLDMILYEYRHGDHSEADKIIKAGYV